MLTSGTSDKMSLYSSFLFSKCLIIGAVPVVKPELYTLCAKHPVVSEPSSFFSPVQNLGCLLNIRTGLAQLVRRRTWVLATRDRTRVVGHYRVRLDNWIGRISN